MFKYYGGNVVPNAKVYAVFWTSGVDAKTQSQIGPYYQSLTNSPFMDWLTEYSTVFSGGTKQYIGRGVFGGAYTITPTATAAHTCTRPMPSGTVCIWDTDIPTELEAQINSGALPPPDHHSVYMFHFPANYVIQSTSMGDSCSYYCSYHSAYTRQGFGNVFFGVMPDMSANGCQAGCGSTDPFTTLTIDASHELAEAITDADAFVNGTGWYDSGSASTGEIADPCIETNELVTGAGGGTYSVQPAFSQKTWNANPVPTTPACVTSRFETNDFDIFFNPNSQTIDAGGSLSIPIHLETTNGTASAVTLSISNASTLPGGVHASLSQTSVSSVAPGGAAVANLNLTADSDAFAGKDRMLVINATAGSLVHSAAILLQVNGTVVTASSNSPLCAPATLNLTATSVSGAAYSWSGPNGFTSTQQNPSIASATSKNSGNYTVTVSINGSVVASAFTAVVVNTPPSVGAYPATFIGVGRAKTVAPTAAPTGATITASVSAGFTGTVSINTTSGVVTVSNAGPAGASYTVTITASGPCTDPVSTTFPVVVTSFTDNPLVARTTIVKGVHLTELRNAVKLAASLVGQTPTFTDDPLPAGTPIKTVHITELRTALTNAFTALHLRVPTFTDPTLTPQTTSVKAVHLQELRNAMQ